MSLIIDDSASSPHECNPDLNTAATDSIPTLADSGGCEEKRVREREKEREERSKN